MNLFLGGDNNDEQPQLRDALTEGYNPIPNFFISARIPNKKSGGQKFLSFDDKEIKAQDNGVQLNRQFENRLFDRDTLLLCHYDVNFLYIASLYGRNNKSAQSSWREYVRKEFRSRIQDSLNRLYTFRVLQPREGMDCYRFIQDNFHLLNGKVYRPKADGNYLILAVMKGDEPKLWEKLGVGIETISREIQSSNELIDSMQSHFIVGDKFKLDTDLHIDSVENVGTLNQLPQQEVKNILTGLVRSTDKDFAVFFNHVPRTYTIEVPPKYINFMDVQYFLPMVEGKIDGYYKVDKVYFGADGGNLCLKLNLSTYIQLGTDRVHIYRTKMQPGELISYDLMLKLYKESI
jgi:hypothetical protein